MEPAIVMSELNNKIIAVVQIIGGLTMLIAILISWLQLKLQRTEVIRQNQRIIELLEEILKK